MTSSDCMWRREDGGSHRFLLDNGAFMIKASLGGQDESDIQAFFNAVIKDKHGPKTANPTLGN